MKKSFKFIAAACSMAAITLLAACGSGGPLGKPIVTPLSYEERKEAAFDDLKESAELFASQFSAAVYSTQTEGKNFVVSPVSVYMALALSAECTAGDTRDELLSALNVTYPVLKGQFSDFYRSILAEYKGYEGDVSGRVDLSNSIWLDTSMQPKDECIQTLTDEYLCYSYAVDFAGNNKGANQQIRDFVKEQTHELIDQDFHLKEETLFALINTLYLKDMWSDGGKELSFTQKAYDFTQSDGTVQALNLLEGHYGRGRVCETKQFKHFYATTYNGCKVKFIVPKEGYTLDDVFTEETLAAVNSISDYGAEDTAKKIRYFTRCLFPEFSASYDQDVKPLLQSQFGVQKLFSGQECDFSTLTDTSAVCTKVQHVAKLIVDKTGVEGAAVTIGANEATSAGPDRYTNVYEDFIVDGAFGFVLTDRYGTTLFSGVINQLEK